MKKRFIVAFIAAIFLGSPATQAAFVAHPIHAENGTAALGADTFVLQKPNLETAWHAKIVKAQKVSFFSQIKTKLGLNKGKSKLIAALLACLLGQFGLHRFYLGYYKIGFIQLALGLTSLAFLLIGMSAVPGGGLLILLILGIFMWYASNIWSFVEFILILMGKLQPRDGAYKKVS